MIPYGHQWLDSADRKAVLKVLKSDWLTQGPMVKKFEEALCRYTGAKYAVAVSHGTAALHMACLAAGIKAGDEVITSPVTFLASANCVVYCGGKVVFADIQEESLNIDPQEIKRKINRKTKAIVPVHFAGHPYDVEAIYKIARQQKVMIIEDACHALGAEYQAQGRWLKVGCCRHSDMAILSFHPVKAITTGEGGAVLTNRKDLYKRLLALRNHGMVHQDDQMRLKEQAADNESGYLSKKNPSSKAPWYYEMQILGYNYRITDIQCALGLSQLKKLGRFIVKRRRISRRYQEAFSHLSELQMPQEQSGCKSAWHIYVLRLELHQLKKTRRQIFEELRRQGIGVHVHYIPVHLQPFYQDRFGYRRGDFPVAEASYDRALTLPLFPQLSSQQCQDIIKCVLLTLQA